MQVSSASWHAVSAELPRGRKKARPFVWIVGAVILLPSIVGFIAKFIDLIVIAQGDAEGAFAISPIANYLFAAAGFFCLMVWAAFQGTFRDLDRPSRAMLENEAALDAQQ